MKVDAHLTEAVDLESFYTNSTHEAQWNKALELLQTKEYERVKTPRWCYRADKDAAGNCVKGVSVIPRVDLPYQTRWWMGTSGNRAGRARGDWKTIDGNYYKYYAPNWLNDYKSIHGEMSPANEEAISNAQSEGEI